MYHQFFPLSELIAINKNKKLNFFDKLELESLLLRLNILYSIQIAGMAWSVRIGYLFVLYILQKSRSFFSSKGHLSII